LRFRSRLAENRYLPFTRGIALTIALRVLTCYIVIDRIGRGRHCSQRVDTSELRPSPTCPETTRLSNIGLNPPSIKPVADDGFYRLRADCRPCRAISMCAVGTVSYAHIRDARCQEMSGDNIPSEKYPRCRYTVVFREVTSLKQLLRNSESNKKDVKTLLGCNAVESVSSNNRSTVQSRQITSEQDTQLLCSCDCDLDLDLYLMTVLYELDVDILKLCLHNKN